MSNSNFAFAEPRKPLALPKSENLNKMKNFISKDYFNGVKQREYNEKLEQYEKDIAAWKAAKAVRDAAKLKKREEGILRRNVRPASEPLHHMIKEPYPAEAIAASAAAHNGRLEEPPKEAYEGGQVIKYGGRRSKKANRRSKKATRRNRSA
jgi:hypothetical protein